MKNLVAFSIAGGIVLIGASTVLAIIFLINSFMCSVRWEDSGKESRYGFFSGCMVQVQPNQWVPEDRVRVLED